MTSKASIFYQNSKKKLMKIDVFSLKIKLSQDLKFATFSFQKVFSLKYLLQSSVSKNFSTKVTSLITTYFKVQEVRIKSTYKKLIKTFAAQVSDSTSTPIITLVIHLGAPNFFIPRMSLYIIKQVLIVKMTHIQNFNSFLLIQLHRNEIHARRC